MKTNYYDDIKEYYNIDSGNFEERYWENKTLQRIRNSFRKTSNRFQASSILEIGFGPGLDVIYFAQENPSTEVFGIDISDGMHDWAKKQVQSKKLSNVKLAIGSVEDIEKAFEGQKFDHIYVYFGALNTVENIQEIQDYLKRILSPDGKMVLTFVNKWYLMAILKPLLKFNIKASRLRLNKIWGGYSPNKFLASKCYSYPQIKTYFNEFDLVYKRGYSILFPAWYENRINLKYPKLCNTLWKVDEFLQHTPFWNLGEYSLYVFQHKA